MDFDETNGSARHDGRTLRQLFSPERSGPAATLGDQ
jgi:hypothetical protein